MTGYLNWLFAGIIASSIGFFGFSKHRESQTFENLIGYENMEVRKLDELEFSSEVAVSIPGDLKIFLKPSDYQKYEDKRKFKQELYRKYNLTEEKVMNMSPLELITKSASIVADNFTYEKDVNPTPKGFIEDDFNNGIGDCNMYTDFTVYIFNLLKEDNTKAKNVYLGDSYYPGIGNNVAHSWNSVYVLSKGKLQIGMIDTTFYESMGELEALDSYHLDENWKNNFYERLKILE